MYIYTYTCLTIRKNIKYVNYLFIIIIAIHSLGITLSGNRMPLILFLFGCFLIFILVKNLRIIMSLGMIIFLVMFIGLINYDKNFSHTYSSYLSEINIFKYIKDDKSKIEKTKVEAQKGERDDLPGRKSRESVLLKSSGHKSIFETSIWVWKMRPLTGFGLKSFRRRELLGLLY